MKHLLYLTLLNLFLLGCGVKEIMPKENSHTALFQYAGHLIKIPVTLNDSTQTYFIFDTGIGVNLLSKKLCEKFGCKITDSYTGQRMSGQSLTIPMSTVASISFAGKKMDGLPFGIWDMNGFLPNDAAFKDVEGFLSLGFFRQVPFTMDYKKNEFIIETPEGLKARQKSGHVIPIQIDEDGPAVTIFMPLKLADGTLIKVEIDLGGDILALNEKFMDSLKIDRHSKTVIVEKRKDETGHPYIRYFSKIPGPISPAAMPMLKQTDLKVMFQKIIYDGLIGNDFMKRFTVTYDLANSQIILNE